MYAYRKPFAAGQYQDFGGVDAGNDRVAVLPGVGDFRFFSESSSTSKTDRCRLAGRTKVNDGQATKGILLPVLVRVAAFVHGLHAGNGIP